MSSLSRKGASRSLEWHHLQKAQEGTNRIRNHELPIEPNMNLPNEPKKEMSTGAQPHPPVTKRQNMTERNVIQRFAHPSPKCRRVTRAPRNRTRL
jgi:hypothetical protein